MNDPTSAVAAPNPLCVEAGIDILQQGGSAVDAAIAALLVATVSEPGVVTPMGGAFVTVWPDSGPPVVVDGNVTMPGLHGDPARLGGGVQEFSYAYGGGVTTFGGAGSVAVPGLLAAVGEAHARYGRVPWSVLPIPAATVARTGFPLGSSAAYYLGFAEPLFSWDPATAAFLYQHGGLPAGGAMMRDAEAADTFEHLAAVGVSSAYSGDLAAALVACMDDGGGLITAADLATYQAVVREPLLSRLGAWRIATNPPPSIGGPSLTAMLHLLAGRPELGVAEIQRLVLSYRRRNMDAAEDLGAAGRELIDSVDRLWSTSSPDTVHVSVVDRWGTACAITASAGYGAGLTVPGTGFMLNNCLGEPELNRRGLHALPAGTRMATNMAPTVATRDDGARLAIGSPGADRITTALMQVLNGFCLQRGRLEDAIAAPRIHIRIDPDTGSPTLEREADAAPVAVDWPVREHEPHSMFFGGVAAALREPGGTVLAAGDPRRDASTGSV